MAGLTNVAGRPVIVPAPRYDGLALPGRTKISIALAGFMACPRAPSTSDYRIGIGAPSFPSTSSNFPKPGSLTPGTLLLAGMETGRFAEDAGAVHLFQHHPDHQGASGANGSFRHAPASFTRPGAN